MRKEASGCLHAARTEQQYLDNKIKLCTGTIWRGVIGHHFAIAIGNEGKRRGLTILNETGVASRSRRPRCIEIAHAKC